MGVPGTLRAVGRGRRPRDAGRKVQTSSSKVRAFWDLRAGRDCSWPGLQLTVLGAPGSPVVRTGRFPSCGPGSISGQGTKILQAIWPGKEERKQHCIVCLRFAKCSQHTQRCHVG